MVNRNKTNTPGITPRNNNPRALGGPRKQQVAKVSYSVKREK